MAEESNIDGNLNVKGTLFTKDLNVSGTAYIDKIETKGRIRTQAGLDTDGIRMSFKDGVGGSIEWPDSGNWKKEQEGEETVTYPYDCGGLKWTGQSDSVKIWCRETAKDNLELCIQFGDDDSNGLVIYSSSGQEVARISATGAASFKQFFVGDKEILPTEDIESLRKNNESLQKTVDKYKAKYGELTE